MPQTLSRPSTTPTVPSTRATATATSHRCSRRPPGRPRCGSRRAITDHQIANHHIDDHYIYIANYGIPNYEIPGYKEDDMKAAIFKGKGSIVVEERPKPSVTESTDAVVR